jgi:hypothetical protein
MIASADHKKTVKERKKREQEAKEQEKLQAIEAKIERARKKMEENKKLKAVKARDVLSKNTQEDGVTEGGDDGAFDRESEYAVEEEPRKTYQKVGPRGRAASIDGKRKS